MVRFKNDKMCIHLRSNKDVSLHSRLKGGHLTHSEKREETKGSVGVKFLNIKIKNIKARNTGP